MANQHIKIQERLSVVTADMVMLSTNEPKQEKERSIKKKSNLAVEDVIPLLLLRAIEEFPMHSKKLPWFGRHSMMPMRWSKSMYILPWY